MSEKGYTHLYFGNGKGKTTAALGLAIRAAGHGRNVVIVQFLKNWACGELLSLESLPNIKVLCAKPGSTTFVRDMTDKEIAETKSAHDDSLQCAIDMIASGQCDLLILDEVIDAYELGVLSDSLLFDLVENKPFDLELVLTGHNKNNRLIESADYVTEMKKIKHPYDNGVNARKGIEF